MQNWLLDAGTIVVAVLSIVRIAVMLPPRARELDFSHYYIAGRLLLEGKRPYSTSLVPLYEPYGFTTHIDDNTSPNPPPLLWLLAALALLPQHQAFWCWVAVEVISLGTTFWLTWQLLRPRLSGRGWTLVGAAVLASPVILWHFGFSQVQLLLAAVMLAAYACHRTGKHTVACLLVTLAGLLKFFPFVLLPWFIWRGEGGMRARLVRGGMALLFGLAVILLTGLGTWDDYLHHGLHEAAGRVVNRVYNFTVPSFVINLVYAAYDYRPPEAVAVWGWMLGLGTGLAILVMAYSTCARGKGDPECEFCLLCVAMLAGSHKAWGHYLVFLIFPLAVAFLRVAAHPTNRRLLWYAAIFVLVNNLYNINRWDSAFLSGHVCLKLLANSMPLYGMVALGIFFGVELCRSSRKPFDCGCSSVTGH